MRWLEVFVAKWWSLFALHMFEVSLFIVLIALVERWRRLSVSTRYALWSMALAKIFIPPLYALPASLPASLPVAITLPSVSVESAASAQALTAFDSRLLFFAAWFVSAVGVTVVFIGRHVQLLRRLHAAQPISVARFSLCPVFETESVISPLLFGVIRTKLYLPRDWRSWPQARLHAILAHEGAHLHGRDLWVLCFETAALIFCGLNPLVWYMRRRLAFLRELRCDLAAISASGMSPLDYSKVLYAFAERQAGAMAVSAAGFAFAAQQSSLFKRLHHLLSRKESEMKTNRFARLLLLVVMGVALLGFSWRCSEQAAQADKASVSPEAENGPTAALQSFDQAPDVTFFQGPKYPEAAKAANLEGEVFLRLTIDAAGEIVAISPVKAAITKHGMPTALTLDKPDEKMDGVSVMTFVEAATEAARSFKFKPALLQGKPVKAEVVVPFKFKLEQSADLLSPRSDVDLC